MGEPRPPHFSTSTALRILERNGVVSHNAIGRTHACYATVSKANQSRSRMRTFIQSCLDDSPLALVFFILRMHRTSVGALDHMIQEDQ